MTPGREEDLNDDFLPSTKRPTRVVDEEIDGYGALDKKLLEMLNTESNSARADSLSETVRNRER
jgi:hypothetical protein